MIPGVEDRYPGIYLTAEESPGKPQLGDHQLRLCDQSLPQMGSLTSKMKSVGLHSTSAREKEGRKGWHYEYVYKCCSL